MKKSSLDYLYHFIFIILISCINTLSNKSYAQCDLDSIDFYVEGFPGYYVFDVEAGSIFDLFYLSTQPADLILDTSNINLPPNHSLSYVIYNYNGEYEIYDMPNNLTIDLWEYYNDFSISYYVSIAIIDTSTGIICDYSEGIRLYNTQSFGISGCMDVNACNFNPSAYIAFNDWCSYAGDSCRTVTLPIDSISLLDIVYESSIFDYDGIRFENCVCGNIGNYEIFVTPFLDVNNNNSYEDGTDQILLNESFQSNPGLTAYYFSNGGIRFYVDSAINATISHIDINSIWDATNSSQVVNMLATDSLYELYFNMQPNVSFVEVSLNLTTGVPICSSVNYYCLNLKNDGTTFSNGLVSLSYSDTLTYLSANPSPDSIVNNQLYFNYTSLAPTHSEQFEIIFQMPSYDYLGDTITINANVNTSMGFQDSLYESAILLCSYDPNDKQVKPNGPANDGQLNITTDTTLNYTIRFQNTGNYMATSVVVRDTISENLDLNSFDFINSSHDVIISLDEMNRVISFNFENIMLPDSGSNQLESNGFVNFEIDVNDNLVAYDIVNNKAEIYFDFNPPIITNTVSSNFIEPVINILEVSQLEYKLYPNLTTGIINISTSFTYSKIELIDLKGNVISTYLGIHEQLDLSQFVDGIYFLRLTTKNNKAVTNKLILSK